MKSLIDFLTGMRTLDAVLILTALLISITYAVICAACFFRHEINVFRGLIDPEDEADDEEREEEEAEYFRWDDDEENWY